MRRRRICVVTGSRAEYGLLFWILRELQADPSVELQLVATAMHLAPEFGHTCDAIEADGFVVSRKVPLDLSETTELGVARAIAEGLVGMVEAFQALLPDLVVVLGDRYEILAAAQAAMVTRRPLAHIHGGEATSGVIDEAIRHAVTKLAHLHFVSAEPHRRRVIQLGESPSRVFDFGAPGLDGVRRTVLLPRAELARALGFALGADFLLVTYHPVTLDTRGPEGALGELMAALDRFPALQVIFTRANADMGGLAVNRLIDVYASRHPERVASFASLGQQRYLSAMKLARAVVGNSSSGIIEAPALGTPTVNLGTRQRGRLRAASVLDCDETASEIVAAIGRALSPDFRRSIEGQGSPFGDGAASTRICQVLATFPLEGIVEKTFHDLHVDLEGARP